MISIYDELRKKKGVTNTEVSKQTGVPLSTLCEWNSGKHTPGADKLLKIADYFEVTVDYLLTGEENYSQRQK